MAGTLGKLLMHTVRAFPGKTREERAEQVFLKRVLARAIGQRRRTLRKRKANSNGQR